MRLFIEVWATLQHFAATDDCLNFTLDKNKRVAATAGSVHDRSAVRKLGLLKCIWCCMEQQLYLTNSYFLLDAAH